MIRSFCAAALLLAAVPQALAQPLPSPSFLDPPLNDASGRAATTNWVRNQGFSTGTGSVGNAAVLLPGSTVARTVAAREATIYNVLDYGAVADGSTDLAPALNAIAAALPAGSANIILIPAGNWALKSAVVFNGVAPTLEGQGFTAGPAPASGTMITVSGTGYVPFTFSGTNARGAVVRDLAVRQVQPAPTAGWQPAAYDYVFKVLNALGEVRFDNVYFAGVTKGIYADNSGRLNLQNIYGQFYTTGVEIDDCYDIPRVEHLHAWSYQTSDPNVIAWQEKNQDTLLLRRVDGIFIGDLFTLAAHSAIHMSNGANGVTTKLYASNVYADFVNFGVLVDGAGSDGQIANITSQNNDQTAPGNTLPAGNAIWFNTNSATLQVGNLYSKLTAGPAVEIDGYGNTLRVANLRANTYGTPGAGAPAIQVSPTTGNNPANSAYVGNKEMLQGVSPLVLFNGSTNGGRQRFLLMNDVGGANVNEARAYSAAPGNPPQLAAIGGDANIDLALSGQGSSGVRLQSAGQTVLRADNVNTSSDDVLFRGGNGSLNLIAEGGDANVDFILSPKGGGGVRLQAGGGQTVLRADNLNASPDDLLVRGGPAAMNLVAEGADSNVDLLMIPKGTGGVRLQANGSTSLRTDNPSAVADDLLVRPGSGTMSLAAEGNDNNINLVLTPKGSGTVVVPTLGSSDSSTNAASTAFVQGAIGGLGLGSLSKQAAGSVAITGGALDGVTLGATTPVVSERVRQLSNSGLITYPAAGSPWLNEVIGATGIVTAQATPHATIQISDAVQNTAPSGIVDGLRVLLTTQAGAAGWRTAGNFQAALGAPSVNMNAGNTQYSGVIGTGLAITGAGGTGTVAGNGLHTGVIGGFWGGNFVARAAPNATWLGGLFGSELDVEADTGSSASLKSGLLIVQTAADVAQGLDGDGGLFIANQTGTAPGWRTGLAFGAPWAQWAIAPGGTIIGAMPNAFGTGTVPMLAGTGLDFSTVDFSGSAIRTPGFSVGPAGGIAMANATLAPNGSGIALDVPAQAVTAAAVAAGGSGYPAGTILRGPNGGLYVATVSGGVVTGVTVVAPDVAGAPPANPVSVTSTTSGSGAVLNLTWSGAGQRALALNPTGGQVTAPTPGAGDNSTKVATTAFVQSAVAAATAGVSTVDGRAGAVTLGSADITGALGFTPYNATNPAGYITPSGAPVQSVAGRTGAITLAVADVAGAAPAASPALTGSPTAPIQPQTDLVTTSTNLATDGFVATALGNYAPLASPAFSGNTSLTAKADAGFKIIGTPPGGGIANSGTYILEATTTGTSATRLTTNGSAPGSGNCINPAANIAMDMFIEVVGLDTTAAGNVSRFRLLDVLFYRGATAASTQVVNGASSAAPNGSIGTGGTAAYSVAADTTNGCLALSVTAPNADTWHWAARVRTTEVQ